MNPKLLTKPFASEGLRNSIAEDVTETTPANAATYTKGFPAVTMTPIAVGGQPPSGKDMNGILTSCPAILPTLTKAVAISLTLISVKKLVVMILVAYYKVMIH